MESDYDTQVNFMTWMNEKTTLENMTIMSICKILFQYFISKLIVSVENDNNDLQKLMLNIL